MDEALSCGKGGAAFDVLRRVVLGRLDDDVAGQWQDVAKINSSRLVHILPKSSASFASNSIIELRPQSTKPYHSTMAHSQLHRAETWHSGVELREHPMPSIEGQAPAAPDLEAGESQQQAQKGGFMSMCARGRHDTSQLVTRRFTEPTTFCIAKGMSRIHRLWEEYQEADEVGSDDDEMFLKFRKELYDHDQFTLQANKMQALDQPSDKFVENYIIGVRGDLNDDDARYTDGPSWDWVLIMNMDKLDQLVRDIPQYRWGRIVLAWFLAKKDEKGEIEHLYYPLKVIRVLLAGVFNCLVASLVGTPVALQMLSITSNSGQVIIYLVFLLAFGFLVQGLAQGTNKQLFLTLAYAGVLAATMKGT
ncbi:hypothetical protein EDB80DRAFT_716366 [Ilyonectria destructans]|nr:hypothetical protein EDB80DRAFT_716366 [Ilyonectria destructans]